ncbi:MAG TPA: NAD(P)/FAD-dependent oxidoreductase [Blastocatellia bacterium]|nr:NAD(P)/FAD-dependent oxidoreductase [Blastocatellia bacterium]
MKYDVIIVGGGPAGTSAGIHLARYGYRVVILERHRFPREKLCGEFIAPEAIPLLDRLGLLSTLRAAGAHIVTEGALIAASGESVAASFSEFRGTPGYGLGLSRRVFDHLLWQKAQACGADVLERFHVHRLVEVGHRTRGVIGTIAGSEREMCFQGEIVIDASGRARQLFSKQQANVRSRRRFFGGRRHSSWIAYRVHLSDVMEIDGRVELYFYSTGYGGVIPIEKGLFNLCAITTWDVARRTHGDPQRLMAATVGEHPIAREKLRRARIEGKVLGVGPLDFGLASETTAVLRIGDARGEMDPFLGQGIWLALQSGELAARLIHGAMSRGDPADVVSAYEASYRAAFGSRFLIARLLRPLAGSPGWGRRVLSFLSHHLCARNLALRATRGW